MADKKWVAGWGCATDRTTQAPYDYLEDLTFRYVIYPTMHAEKIRIHFSNMYGYEPIKVKKVYIATRESRKAAVPGSEVEVTFGGRTGFELAPGEACVSDEIDFGVLPAREFFVSMYMQEKTLLYTGHWNSGAYITKYYCRGDYAAEVDIPDEIYGDGGPYVYINTIDFLTDDDSKAIIAFGDSITAQPWPDCFARRLTELGIENRAIVRKAIGGNRVLRDYKHRIKKHWGEAGIKRFESEIKQAGADRVFVLHGINDIIHPGVANPLCGMEELPTAEELIEGYKKYVSIARENGMKIYFGTLLPCPRCLKDDGIRESLRCAANEWIRTTDLIDGYIDYEQAVWLESDHKQMDPLYDSGDHLHPSLEGARKMAYTVPEEYFR